MKMNNFLLLLSLTLVIDCCLAASATTSKPKPTTKSSTTTADVVTTSGTCCPASQGELDSITAEVAALQEEVIDLQDQLDKLETTLNYYEAKQSCDDFKAMNLASGYYDIDPDGPDGAMAPFEVYCDMNSDPEWAVTMLSHDSEDRTLVSGCQNPGCFSHDVTYQQSWNQINAIISTSESCQQYLSYECFGSMMFEYADYAWWVSRYGENQYYWPGAEPGSRMCACGQEGNCTGTSTTCNCDNNDFVWRQDDGYLANKTVLPVTQLNFGDVLGVEEQGYFTLGKLECKGRASTSSCAGLKQSGYPSGEYTIAPNENVEPFTIYCDMESYPGTGIAEISHNRPSGSLSYYSDTSIDVTYTDVTMEQIVSLINSSDHCEQYISWRCTNTGMFAYGHTWWLSRDGKKMTYWGGAEPGHENYCGCGETGTCFTGNNYNYKCNCDNYIDGTTRVDAGYLYDKNTLPVTHMQFAMDYYYYSGYYYSSSGYYNLGKLRCY